MSWIARLATKGVSRLAANTVKRATTAEIKAGTKAAIKTGGRVAVKNPLKLGALGVLGYSGLTDTNPFANLWNAVSSPLDFITNHGLGALVQSLEEPFMEGVLIGGALKLGGVGNTLVCLAVPGGVEFLLNNHDFSSDQFDPFHVVWNVAPAAVGGYLGCKVVGFVM